MAEGRVESLLVQLAPSPDTNIPIRMLSLQEQEQLRASKKAVGEYVERILNTTPTKNE